MEKIFAQYMVPHSLDTEEKMKCLYYLYACLDTNAVKSVLPPTHAHTHKNADTHRNWMNSLNTLIHSCCRRFCGSESCKAREWRREEESTIVKINKANKTATSYMSLIGWPCKPRRRMGKIDGKDRQSARKHAQSISLASGRSLWDFENITLK